MKRIDGSYITIPMDDDVRRHFDDPYNYTKEIQEQFEADLYKYFIDKEDKIILDIGANVGLFALHVGPYAKRIICVEPVPQHMEIQRILVPGAGHEQAALHNYTGETKFFWCGINTTMCSIQDRGDAEMIVPCITLFDLCKKYNLTKVDFCKIDIEGGEWSAITIQMLIPVFDIIDKIFIELHPPTAESQKDMKSTFEAVGYKVETYLHDSLFAHK